MKTLLFFLLISFSSLAQSKYDFNQVDQPRSGLSSSPFKGCTQIIVQTQDDYPTAYKNLKMSFVREGFHITYSDAETNSVSAEITAKRAGKITVSAVVLDEGIFYNGHFESGMSIQVGMVGAGGVSTIENRGMKGSAFMIAFDQMESVAKAYQGDRIIYSIK